VAEAVLTKYEAWETKEGFAFFPADQLEAQKRNLATRLVKKLFDVEAHSPEEASALYNLRMGWEPYKPMGIPQPCPKCQAWFYPEGSGHCWRCGPIC
jgi:hypothetical protein